MNASTNPTPDTNAVARTTLPDTVNVLRGCSAACLTGGGGAGGGGAAGKSAADGEAAFFSGFDQLASDMELATITAQIEEDAAFLAAANDQPGWPGEEMLDEDEDEGGTLPGAIV